MRKTDSMLNSQLEILAQGHTYLESVTKEDYSQIVAPNFISSAGSHMRHIIDHYQSLMTGFDINNIDYDSRLRGSNIESNPCEAIKKIAEIASWIEQLSTDDFNKPLLLSSEVSIKSKNVQTVTTSLARELIFVGSHAVHHYAMISQITFAQKASFDQSFGLAPSTATFLREKSQSKSLQS
ncbi:hypothetical protein WNY79_10335 [Pseudoalteromonas sp. AS84]|nr:hypothetical protein [Pseudoalteromonas sp. NSLLW218]|tara:strand:+ start:167 stop:709 length:543 start_codon:yes stop_codon:yes gene_type:complete